MTWAGVLVVSLFSLDLACATASQTMPEGLCKGTQGQMIVAGFPYLCYPHTFIFSCLEHLILLVPVLQQKSWIRNGKLHLCISHWLVLPVSSHDMSDASVASASRDAGYLTKSRRDNPAEEDSSCLYFKRKNIWAKMKIPDTKHQKFKALTDLCNSRPMCIKQNNLQFLHLCSQPFMCLR